MRLYRQFPSYDTYTMTCTNIGNLPINNRLKAQAFTVHYSVILKFTRFTIRNNLRKYLSKFQCDSLRRNPIRCGIDAKVRRKNEMARVLAKNFLVFIRNQGIRVRKSGVWRMKSKIGETKIKNGDIKFLLDTSAYIYYNIL